MEKLVSMKKLVSLGLVFVLAAVFAISAFAAPADAEEIVPLSRGSYYPYFRLYNDCQCEHWLGYLFD